MSAIEKYFKELNTITIELRETEKGIPYWDLSNYCQYKSEKRSQKLKGLSNDIISKTIQLTPEQIKQIKEMITKIDLNYNKAFKVTNDNGNPISFETFKKVNLKNFTIKWKNKTDNNKDWFNKIIFAVKNISKTFFYDFTDYLMINETSFLELKEQLKPYINNEKQTITGFETTFLEPQQNEEKQTITGFKTILTEYQQSKLYKTLQNNYIDCTEVEFKAIFTDNPQPIKWIDKGTTRHEPNKQTIFEFIYLLKEYNHLKDSKTDLDTTGNNRNNFNRKLEFIFPEIKNFSQSSGTGKSAKNTSRKKELEKIIKSL